MSLDAALRDVVAAELAPLLDEVRGLRAEVEALRVQSAPSVLRPLAEILNISPRAALGRIERDAALRGIGVLVGRRLMFREAEVVQLFRARSSMATQ